jgi:hypothetical protein
MSKWTYSQTAVPVHGSIIHFSPMADCGYFRTATLSIIKIDKGDTIRVLQICDTTKRVVIYSKVTLPPPAKVKKEVSLIPSDPATDCVNKKPY